MILHEGSSYEKEMLNLIYSSVFKFKRQEAYEFPDEIKYHSFNVFFMYFCGYK